MQAKAEAGAVNCANVVIFVDFQDTTHVHNSAVQAYCYREDIDGTFEMFDGDGSNGSSVNPRSLKQYLNTISYGKYRINNVYPQYDGTTITPFRLKNNAEYYVANDSAMIGEIAEYLKDYDEQMLDLAYSDGCIDNVTIIVPYDSSEVQFVSHHATYGGLEKINNCLIRSYSVVSEGGAYLGVDGSGVIIHEFLHGLGYPDLYRNSGTATTARPVGAWDIMASTSRAVQYPLAYLRSAITEWFSIHEITESVEGYTLYAASKTTAETRDKQAIILKTAYSDTEFFVVEYRKQGNTYNGGVYTNELECKIPGSGLIVYRVNKAYEGNVQGPPDMIYVFRPGDSYNSSGYERGNGYENQSFLSQESGRTSYGLADLSKTLEDGAITYADGTNSGIVISNVGSTSGDSITFDVSFSEEAQKSQWELISAEQEDAFMLIASYMDSDGTAYFVQQKTNSSGGDTYLYKYKGSWSVLGSAPQGMSYQLTKYGDTLYLAYISSQQYIKLAKWTGSAFEDIYTSSYRVNEIDVSSDASGIYIAGANTDGTRIMVHKYTDVGVTDMGSQVCNSTGYIANPSVSVGDGTVVVMYREAFNDNRLFVKKYDSQSNLWNDVGSLNMAANSGMVQINSNKIYLLKNGTDYQNDDSYMYTYDMAADTGVWEQLGTNYYTNENVVEMDICFLNDRPYIAYQGGSSYKTYVSVLMDGEWKQLGTQVTNGIVSGLQVYDLEQKIYVTYLSNTNQKTYIKRHAGLSESSNPTPPVPVLKPTPTAVIVETPSPTTIVIQTPTPSVVPGITPTSKPTVEPGIDWPFIDVTQNPGNWKYEAVKYVYENGIMTGTKPNEFQPDAPLTRAMFATMLYRMAGQLAVTYTSKYPDVPEGKWFSNAVIWASQKGIVSGYGNGRFGTDDYITREQIAKMLMEYGRAQGYNVGQSANFNNFADAGSVSGWANNYMKWAVGSGMISGSQKNGKYYLNPKGNATRAESATMLKRFMEKYK